MAYKKKVPPMKPPVTHYWEWDGTHYRWWRDDNPGDMFDRLEKDEHVARLANYERRGKKVEEGMPD